MSGINDTNEMKKQYGTDQNLNSRILLHRLFSTNKQGWRNWVFQNYELKPGLSVLELGCGNAGIWKSNAEKIPHSTRLVLSDFSPGMLDAAKANTDAINSAEYRVIDAREIPFDTGAFDIVIANHMLYHVPDIDKALSEISRILKPDGTFYATTLGKNNFREIIDLLYNFDDRIDFAQDSVTEAFGLETGGKKLGVYFNTVRIKKYPDSLHITQARPLVDYILSSQGIGNVADIISGDTIARFTQYINDLFIKKPFIDVQKDAGIFIAADPNP
jgi:SAM-dependent methyltransferase